MNNYELFGLTPDATDEEFEAAYLRLREQYREDRWLEGEAGNDAARKLTQLEAAYKELKAERFQQHKQDESGEIQMDAYAEVTKLLKEGKINEAQALLDDFNERDAEWHYLQAVVFYKKNWMNESKKQLEIAMQMDPNCVKYRETYGKLNAKTEYENKKTQGQNGGQGQGQHNPYSTQPSDEPQQMGGGGLCDNCCSCCCTYLCVDALCSTCCCR